MVPEPLVRRLHLHPGRVDVPAWLEDVTWYAFRDRDDDNHLLELSMVLEPSGDSRLELERRRERMLEVHAPNGAASPVLPVEGTRFPAAQFAFESSLFPNLQVATAGLGNGAEILVVAYSAREDAGSTLRTIARSASLAGAPIPAAAGYRRVAYRTYALDIPGSLAGPRRFDLRSRDVRLEVERVTDSDVVTPNFAAALGLDIDPELHVIDSTTASRFHDPETGQARGSWRRWLVERRSPDGLTRYVFRAALLPEPNTRTALRVSVHGPENARADLDQTFETALASLRFED